MARGCGGRVVLALAAALAPSAAAMALARGGGAAAERPVMKVVRLLQDMKVELEKELEDDKAVHESLGCWCKTNEQEKTKAIEMGRASAGQLKSTRDESAAKVVELKAKRKSAVDEIFADQKALGEAAELRMKDNKKFHAEEADLMEAVAASRQAVVVLSKHHPELAQVRSAANRLHDARASRLLMASGSLRKDQLEILKGFLQQAAQASSFLAVPGFESYAPQSGQIFGILKQLQEDFESSLGDAQKSEQQAQVGYESLKAAKQQEIAAGQKEVAELDSAIAEFDEKAVQAGKELEDTDEQLALDTEFLGNLRTKCSQSESEFESRVQSRLQEISAVADTIQILNSETAFDNFGKTASTMLLQTASVSAGLAQDLRRKRAAAVLGGAATRTGASQLALLAASVQLDAFEKVQEAIDKLVAELATQQKDEVAHRDWCITELAKNDREVASADDKLAGLKTKVADLEKTIAAVSASIDTSKATVAELDVQMKRASENREGQNADYQQTIIDQRLTQEILKKAKDRLGQAYAMLQQAPAEPKSHSESESPETSLADPEDVSELALLGLSKPGAPHTQTSATHTDPGNGPARFTKYEQHADGARVLQLLDSIITDSQKTEAESMASEADAQAAYESFMKDSNKSLEAHAKSITDLSSAKAQAEESLSLAKDDLTQTLGTLEGLNLTGQDLHGNCDYIMKNFETRQAARTAESEALKEAKAILSGMK